MILFTKVSLPYGWLSNMSPHPIESNWLTFKTAEHYMQSLRFNVLTQKDIIEKINRESSPMKAKMIAKSYENVMRVKPKSPEDLANVQIILCEKILQHKDIHDMLLETGDEIIVEDVTKRGSKGNNLFWGAMLVDGKLIGENHLGRLWMECRTIFRKRAKNLTSSRSTL